MEAGSNGPWDGLDVVGEAIEADARTLGASVDCGETDGRYVLESAFVSVEGRSVSDACGVAESIVSDALASLGLETEAKAVGVFDERGNFVDVRAESADIANPS